MGSKADSGVRHWLASAILATLALGLGSPAAALVSKTSVVRHDEGVLIADSGIRLAEADCDDIDLQVSAEIGEQSCRAASLSNSDARARVETVNALGAGTLFFAEHMNAGLHTYIHRSTPAEVAERADLKKAAGEPDARLQAQGFDVWRFKDAGGMHCAVFTKHWSRVPRTSGYRHRIVGIYCSQRAADVADARLNDVLASVEPTE
jgi:hypothetical protein